MGDPTSRLLAHAILLSHRHGVRVLELGSFTSDATRSHVHTLIAAEAAVQGRTVSFVDAGPPTAIGAALAGGAVDAFLVDALEDLNGTDVSGNGSQLGPSLETFLGNGGVVVVWTSQKAENATQSFLNASGLLEVASMNGATGNLLVSDWLDALSIGEPSPFAPTGTVTGMVVSTPVDPTMSFVIRSSEGAPVVVHRAYVPTPHP